MCGKANHIARLVRRLGGQNATARLSGARQSEVWRWVQQGHIPSTRIPAVIAGAAKLDPPVLLRPDDFFEVSSGATPSHSEASAA